MFDRLLRRLVGGGSKAPAHPNPVPAAGTQPTLPAVETLTAALAATGAGPVFSSRAVRDAAVVTAAVDALKRFAEGVEPVDDLAFRLEGLRTDQLNFLQLSVEPLLLQRCIARGEDSKGAKAAALRRMLSDLAGGASPSSFAWSRPEKPVQPAATTVPPSPAAAAWTRPSPPPSAIPPRPAPLAARPLPVARPMPAPPVPPVPPATPVIEPDVILAVAPAPASPPADVVAALPPPAPPPRRPEPPSGPCLARADADARRQQLIQALTLHLSSDEAAP